MAHTAANDRAPRRRTEIGTAAAPTAAPAETTPDTPSEGTTPNSSAVGLLDLLATCIDSLWAAGADEGSRETALSAIGLLARTLRTLGKNSADAAARRDLAHVHGLASAVRASTGSGLHRAICLMLEDMLGMPRAETSAAVLPHVLAVNAPSLPDIDARLGRLLNGGRDHPAGAVGAIHDLYRDVDAPRALVDHGFLGAAIPGAVRRTLVAVPPENPSPLTEEDLTWLFTDALNGDFDGRDERAAVRAAAGLE